MADGSEDKQMTRRDFLRLALRGAGLFALGTVFGLAWNRRRTGRTVWQIDPSKCTACGLCATQCVLEPSAVKCVHDFAMCGYCDRCTGFFDPKTHELKEGAENQLCPMGAIQRRFVEDPYHEYHVDEARCIGCGRCSRGCEDYGNGSLYLQVRHDLCLNCNQCRIASNCPADAFMRVPAGGPLYVKKSEWKARA